MMEKEEFAGIQPFKCVHPSFLPICEGSNTSQWLNMQSQESGLPDQSLAQPLSVRSWPQHLTGLSFLLYKMGTR